VREGYFALLIPSKWEFSKEYVQTIKRLLHWWYIANTLEFFLVNLSFDRG